MDACTCHLCGDAMEPDVVLAQGDTCELCYFLHLIPVDLARKSDDGLRELQSFGSLADRNHEGEDSTRGTPWS